MFTTYTTNGQETWFEFTATSPDVQISVVSEAFGTNAPHVHNISLFSGACGSLDLIAQDELPFIAIANNLTIDASGLVVGDTYHIRANVLASAAACTKLDCPGTAVVSFVLCIQDIEVFLPLDVSLLSFGIAEMPSLDHVYYTNKGQIIDTDGNPRRDIISYTFGSEPNVYVTDNNVSYVFTRADTDTIFMHRVDMSLNGANTGVRAFKAGRVANHLNFYLEHIPTGITNMEGYMKIICNDVYPNIDMQYYSNSEGMKIYFIVHPGGDPKDIELQYTGATSTSINSLGHLEVETPLGKMEQDFGHTFMIDSSGNISPLLWNAQYKLMGNNRVRFKVQSYPTNLPLIIQIDQGHKVGAASSPAEWVTYFGGTNDDAAYDLSTDDFGNVYMVGTTKSTSATFPVTPGAWDTTQALSLLNDVFVAKFNPDYGQEWTTYLGAASSDEGWAISHTQQTNGVYVAGATRSDNYPFQSLGTSYTQSAISFVPGQALHRGFITRLDDGKGFLEWSTFFGDTVTFIMSLDHDINGFLYVGGHTRQQISGNITCQPPPNEGFPICNSGGNAYYQDFHAGGSSLPTDGFIARFNQFNELVHSTYFGGNNVGNSGDDFIYDITIDDFTGSLYVVGETNTDSVAFDCLVQTNGDFPGCDNGGYRQPSPPNTQLNPFIAKFDMKTMELKWSTMFAGNNKGGATAIATNALGEVFVTGYTFTTTSSLSCLPPTTGGFPLCANGSAHFGTFSGSSGDYNLFVAKFLGNDSLNWSTLIGGLFDTKVEIFPCTPARIAVSDKGHIYLTGTTRSGFFPDVDGGIGLYYQSGGHADLGTAPIASDAFLTMFDESDMSLAHSTFFGGKGSTPTGLTPKRGDLGMAITTFQDDRVYVAGITHSTSLFPISCPLTSNPYCDSICSGCNTDPSPSTDGDAFIAQLLAGPFTGINEEETILEFESRFVFLTSHIISGKQLINRYLIFGLGTTVYYTSVIIRLLSTDCLVV